jgi:sugar lactone lactonase YvrE
MVTDVAGNLYATDVTFNRLRCIVLATGAVLSMAGNGTASFANGIGNSSSFSAPRGLAIDTVNQILFAADSGNNRIRRIAIPTWSVSTIAGSDRSGYADGIGSHAAFNQPMGVTLLPGGDILFVADTNNNCIRRLEIFSGAVTTLVGSIVSGFADGFGSAAMFAKPHALAADAFGSLFVLEVGTNRVRLVILSTRSVSTLTGTYASGFRNGPTRLEARFNSLSGLAISSNSQGNPRIFVTDSGNRRVRAIDANGPLVDMVSVPCSAGSRRGSWPMR